ncbi:MAG: DNA-directed RNA polymerase [Thermoplasmata archaeon HGW-Thermoplasmata-1]|nr:MAG: DNA-directed RNA polymerase [Thermoplasmata archaeon HGW-Thermoplasmata-1]
MYRLIEMEETIRIPPNMLGEDLTEVTRKLVASTFESTMGKNGLMVITSDIERLGEGMVIHGDGAVYQMVKFNALAFTPEIHELTDALVCQIAEFGAFCHIGPLDALAHQSQIMNDFVNTDVGSGMLTGKDTKRSLKIGDGVRARIVTVSINETNPRESKIGLTMRQPTLGKFEWVKDDRTKSREAAA